MKKTSPLFARFLAEQLDADATTINNTIRFSREEKFLSESRSGNASTEVTPLDASNGLLAVVAGWGRKPLEGVKTLASVRHLTPLGFSQLDRTGKGLSKSDIKQFKADVAIREEHQSQPAFDGLQKGWWRGRFDEVLARVIEARIADENFDQHKLSFEIITHGGSGWSGRVRYGMPGDEGFRETNYIIPDPATDRNQRDNRVKPMRGVTEQKTIEHWVPLVVADWLAERNTSWADLKRHREMVKGGGSE
jgi:hypothetical protein